ncbi:MAG TPA: DUF1450 domain-containing protein [Tissierellaceae bacterium]
MPHIQFCENNFTHGTEEVVNKLRDENYNVEVESCLGYCGDCATNPFALVDEEFIEADNPEALYEKIINHLEK